MREIPKPVVRPHEVLVKVKAAGICHSDVHYRAGISARQKLPLTLGHEVAGIVEEVGEAVTGIKPGARVALHYLVTCGHCKYCLGGHEQFCPEAKMLGHHLDGGYAEYCVVPARNALLLPDAIPFEQGATLMCASATALHALLKSRIKKGDTVAVFGMGGLGQSAVQLARALGAAKVYAVDIHAGKLEQAARFGAVAIRASQTEPVAEIKRQNGGGVDVALELVGLPLTQKQALQSVGPLGRIVMVGLSAEELPLDTYREILANEAEMIGSNDHLLEELTQLMDFAGRKLLDVSAVVSRTIPLDAGQINEVLDDLEQFKGNQLRTVIVM